MAPEKDNGNRTTNNPLPQWVSDYFYVTNALYRYPDLKKDHDRFMAFEKKYWRNAASSASSIELVLTAHLFIEQSMNAILEASFTRPDKLQRFSFAQKLNILDAMGTLSEEHVSVLKAVNKLRNNIAHDLDYEVTLNDVHSMQKTIPKSILDKGIAKSLIFALSGACGLIHRIETHVTQGAQSERTDT